MLVFNQTLSVTAFTKFDLEKAIGYFAYLRVKSHPFTDSLKLKYDLLEGETEESSTIRIHNWNQWHNQTSELEFNLKDEFHFFIERIEDEFNYPISIHINSAADHGVIMHINEEEQSFDEIYDIYGGHTPDLETTFDMDDFICELRSSKDQKRIEKLEKTLQENGVKNSKKILDQISNENPFMTLNATK